MDKLITKILNRLSAGYPSFINLEECRKGIAEDELSFKRGIAYLQEKAFVDLRDLKQGIEDGIYGEARITASGLDWLSHRSRQVKATVIR